VFKLHFFLSLETVEHFKYLYLLLIIISILDQKTTTTKKHVKIKLTSFCG